MTTARASCLDCRPRSGGTVKAHEASTSPPAPARRPTTQPQSDQSLHRRARPDPHRRRPPRRRATPGDRRAHALLQAPTGVPPAPTRVPQPRTARPARRAARPPRDHRRTDELRPTAAAHPRADHAQPRQPPLPAHPHQPRSRHAAHPRPDPAPTARPGPTHRPRPSPQRTAARNYRHILDQLAQDAGFAA
jgi:hypothetical protein